MKLSRFLLWWGINTVLAVTFVAAHAPAANLYEYDISRNNPDQEPPPSPIKMGSNTMAGGGSFSLNSLYFTRDERPWLPVVGEMQYARVPRPDWDEEILKMKNGGINIISSYVFWLFHEEVEGHFDWSGNRSIHDFLEACQRHQMLVLLRIGPWDHAELRHGGFPDWLMKDHGKLRTNDRVYLKSVDHYFGEMGEQIKGELFKENGPLIGIQLENEFSFEKEPDISYMHALKQLAIDHGIDVPIYTEFAWPGGPPGETGFLPMLGRYPDAPWNQTLKRLVRDNVYRFDPVRFDPIIGEDLLGARVGGTAAPQPFPIAMAELGSGLQETYHRRPVLTASDVVAAAYVEIGSGANLIGYYVFHGGENPIGKLSTFQESRATGYPNDLPYINYDFQAPLGMYGQARPSFYEYRSLHLFLNDFGSLLAPERPFFPDKPTVNITAIPPLRYAIRAKGDTGFLFVNNYRRFNSTPDLSNVQFRILTSKGSVVFPEKPCLVKSGSYFIWPFHLPMADVQLNYATAQPLCIIPSEKEILYVFSATEGIVPTFQFDSSLAGLIKAVDPSATKVVSEGTHTIITVDHPGTSSSFAFITPAGRHLKVVTLTHSQSLQASRIILNGQPHLLLSSGAVLCENPGLRLRHIDSNQFTFSLYPPLALQAATRLQTTSNGFLTQYTTTVPPQAAITIKAIPAQPKAPPMPPEVESTPQPGSLYQPKFTLVPGSSTWDLQIPPDAMAHCCDMLVEVGYTGDTAALYSRDALLMDQYNSDGIFPISLRHFAGKLVDSVRLQIVPLTKSRRILFDDPTVAAQGTRATIRHIEAHPVYELSLRVSDKKSTN